jgi:hypothetical protein
MNGLQTYIYISMGRLLAEKLANIPIPFSFPISTKRTLILGFGSSLE